MTTLSPEECAFILKKLEYTFKKKANIELLANEGLTELSAGATILLKLQQGAGQ